MNDMACVGMFTGEHRKKKFNLTLLQRRWVGFISRLKYILNYIMVPSSLGKSECRLADLQKCNAHVTSFTKLNYAYNQFMIP